MGNKKIMLLSVVFGVLAVVMVNYYLNQVKASLDNVQKAQVLVAKTLIPAKTEVNSEMVELRLIPRQYIHPQAITKPEKLAGEISLMDIQPGEQLLTSKFVYSKDASQGLDFMIPKGKRAIAVGVDGITGVANMVKPGNKVDVIAIMDVDKNQAVGPQGTPVVPSTSMGGGKSSTAPTSKMILQNITVLAVNQLMENMKAPVTKDGAVVETKTLTLAVTPEEAERLTLITERGVIRVVLRSPVEDGKYVPKPYSTKDFLLR